MDIRSYIESGIIEKFVLGVLPKEESSILECVMANNEEVKQAVLEAQETINQLSFANSVQPPAELKAQIFSKLSFEKPVVQETILKVEPSEEVKTTILKELNISPAEKKSSVSTWLAAASIALLMALGWNIFQNYNIQKNLEASNLELRENKKEMQMLAEQNQMILNSENIKLKGVEQHPGMLANVFWDNSKMVYLSVENLPKAPEGKQYQLWAIVDGKPVDAGMYETNSTKIQEMKKIPNAQAFAITLEKEGGSETPTMEEMYVMGAV